MSVWFFICMIGLVATIPVHFLSVEHLRLQRRYGKAKGRKYGDILGLVSGWGFFLFWAGIWFSPQSRFNIPILQDPSILIPLTGFSVSLFQIIVCISFLLVGGWVAISGVKETSLKVSETHRTEKIVTGGVYSHVRHPQYLGGLLAHVGISFLLSASYALLSTPLMILLVYLISRKEEEELAKEFGREYEDYKRKVPMMIP